MCHQTVSLIARFLEENGIPTVVMGCAKDIVEHWDALRAHAVAPHMRAYREQVADIVEELTIKVLEDG